MNKTIDDPCAIQLRSAENNKKFKFITTNHIDLLEAKEKLNYFGISLKDQLFVPAEKVEVYSQLLNGVKGSEVTNPNLKYGLGPLPVPTLPSRYQLFHGDVDIEDGMRNVYEINKKSCIPMEQTFHDRHFSIFDDSKGIETPMAFKSIETDAFGPRGGLSTRHLPKQK